MAELGALLSHTEPEYADPAGVPSRGELERPEWRRAGEEGGREAGRRGAASPQDTRGGPGSALRAPQQCGVSRGRLLNLLGPACPPPPQPPSEATASPVAAQHLRLPEPHAGARRDCLRATNSSTVCRN